MKLFVGVGAAGVVFVLVTAGCGGSGSVSTSSLGSASQAVSKHDAAAYTNCRNKVGPFLRSELVLEAHLAGGPNHRQYVRDIQLVSFGAETDPIPALRGACFLLSRRGFYAFEDYRKAAQIWNSCLRSTPHCSYDSIKPRLHAIWAQAATQAAQARAGLRGLLHGA